jgi:hypothetical protein
MEKKTYEKLALLVIALVTLGTMLSSLYYERQLSNQKAMFYQLQALRVSINLYKAINGGGPRELSLLFMEEFKFPDEDTPRRYMTGAFLNSGGQVLDPFGNPYKYDGTTGWLCSTTRGYEYW